jgi:hypothetical protein
MDVWTYSASIHPHFHTPIPVLQAGSGSAAPLIWWDGRVFRETGIRRRTGPRRYSWKPSSHKECRAGTLTQRRTCPARMEASWGLREVPGNEIANATRAARPILCNARANRAWPDGYAAMRRARGDGSVLFGTQLSAPLDRLAYLHNCFDTRSEASSSRTGHGLHASEVTDAVDRVRSDEGTGRRRGGGLQESTGARANPLRGKAMGEMRAPDGPPQ